MRDDPCRDGSDAEPALTAAQLGTEDGVLVPNTIADPPVSAPSQETTESESPQGRRRRSEPVDFATIGSRSSKLRVERPVSEQAARRHSAQVSITPANGVASSNGGDLGDDHGGDYGGDHGGDHGGANGQVVVPSINLSKNVVEKSALSERRSQSVFATNKQASARIYPVLLAPTPSESPEDEKTDLPEDVQPSQSPKNSRRRTSSYSTASKTLTLRTLQITARSSVTPSTSDDQGLDPVRHRIIFLRTQKSLADIFVMPVESNWGRRVNQVFFVWILVSIATMAFATCDGPNLGSSSPGYPLLPTKEDYKIFDMVFTLTFTVEVFIRLIINKFSLKSLKHPLIWIDIFALSPWYIQQFANSTGYEFDLYGSGFGYQFNLFRLARTLRLGYILRHYEQTKILIRSVKTSLPPLGVTLFFLFTLVMVLATALFYAEPCYNVNTCTFTDIFNSAYFIMVSVATVGYGSQVPSLRNPGSMAISCTAMILGQIYFSMPIAIIGNNFGRTYESFQMNKKQKMRFFDASLSPFDCQDIHERVERLCDIQYHVLNAWQIVQRNIQQVRRVNRAFSLDKATEDLIQSQRLHHGKIMEAMENLLTVHAEACQLIQSFIPHKRRIRRSLGGNQTKGLLNGIYARARQVMAKARFPVHRYSAGLDARVLSQTFKGRLWLLLEVPDSSRSASYLNKAMVVFSLLSIMLFYLESLPELASAGVETLACKQVVKDYCKSDGFYRGSWSLADPGCYVRREDGKTNFSLPLDFSCSSTSTAKNCYGAGLNFGSLNESALTCAESFFTKAVSIICYRQQCHPVATTLMDMGPYWIFFEWYFGALFTIELVFRFYISQNRRHFLKDFYIAFDVLAVVPFVVEVFQYMSDGVKPDYAIVATSPSFLSVIRVLKIMRILKLTRHFRGTKVIASTAKRVWERLLVPLFFLFGGAIICGAVFYEVERGTQCFVGEECMWWGKNVLTPWLEEGLPAGKRIQIQDQRPTTITDMIHSAWLSYTTLTSVGYGDLTPRTSIGRAFAIIVIIISTIYSAMPLSLVGTQFYSLYEKHLEKMVVKRGGSSHSWRTKRNLTDVRGTNKQQNGQGGGTAQGDQEFRLTDEELDVVHQFETVKRTIVNLQRNLENIMHVTLDIRSTRSIKSTMSIIEKAGAGSRSTDTLDQAIETKTSLVLDTLLQFSLVVERLHDAPTGYEAFLEADRSRNTVSSSQVFSPRGISQFMPSSAPPDE